MEHKAFTFTFDDMNMTVLGFETHAESKLSDILL